MVRLPLIAMPVRMDPSSECQYLQRQYADAIAAAGGAPVLLPLLANPGHLRDFARELDGVLLTGSNTDVDPRRYGSEKEAECGPVQPLRDETDALLLEVAFERRTPVLAICFGIQSLNVFAGGTLIQDIPVRVETKLRHSDTASRFAHPVQLAEGSGLHRLAGRTEVMVNSTHHQALDRIGGGLKEAARAPDGIVEAVMGTDHRHWVLGVQWHPEKSYDYDEFSRKIFESFLAQCRRG